MEASVRHADPTWYLHSATLHVTKNIESDLRHTKHTFSGLALKGNKQSPSRSVAAYYTTG